MFGSAPATFMMSRPFHHHGHSQDEYTVAAESLLQLLAWLANGVHTRIHGGPGKPSPGQAHTLTERRNFLVSVLVFFFRRIHRHSRCRCRLLR